MIFTSFEFVFFFVAVVLVRGFLRNFTTEKWFLLASSYVFYMSWSIPCAILILLTSIVDYFVGEGLGQIEDSRKRKFLLVVSIVANLGVLGFFKYTNFLLDNIWWGFSSLGLHTSRWHYDILLPVGISFFTFQSMTYTIETYRRNIKPCHSLRDFLLFVAFFPQLLAGPINRAADLIPQFVQRVRATAVDFEIGLSQFALGAVKKLAISDRIASHVDLIFGAPGNYDGFTLLQGLLGYAVQIYCDFSGYSDMAIGCARMMGFRFIENFQMPYSATNITEFWRRWHISLSTWFRDYLYIPMGGSRKSPACTYKNLMLTMLLCGLWHGSSWNFVFWGGLHGVSLAVHRAWRELDPLESFMKIGSYRLISNIFCRMLTISIVLVGWIFFRVQSWIEAEQYLVKVFNWSDSGNRMISPYIISAVVVVLLMHFLFHKDRKWAHEIPQRPIILRVISYSVLLIIITCIGGIDAAPFIYFQF